MNRELIFKLSDALLDEKITVDSADWELLLGQIITNRVVGIAYKNLKKNNVKTFPAIAKNNYHIKSANVICCPQPFSSKVFRYSNI